MNPLPDRIAAALSAYSQSVEDHTNASSVPSASKMLACLQGLTTAIAELVAERDEHRDRSDRYGSRIDELLKERTKAEVERDRAVAERDEAQRMASLMEHKVITCGVAAHHPDANLTRTGAYADKWDSPQAKDVRKVRSERDAAVAVRAELERMLRLLTSDLNGVNAKLAGLLAAAKSASELVEDLYGYAITDWAWKYGPEWLAQRDAFRCAIAAAEQGGA